MRKTEEIPEKKIIDIKHDYKENGLSQRELAKKYKFSTTKIRTILGIRGKKPKKQTKAGKVAVKTARKKAQKELNKQKVEEIETQTFKEIVQGNYIDVFQSIRESVQDMVDLNKEQTEALEEMQKNIQEIAKFVHDKADELDPIREQLWKAMGQINSYWGRGKLRVMSRDQLGKWIDRVKEFNLITLQFNYYENIIKALFEGINTLPAEQYKWVRNSAITIFGPTETYYIRNEQQTAVQS